MQIISRAASFEAPYRALHCVMYTALASVLCGGIAGAADPVERIFLTSDADKGELTAEFRPAGAVEADGNIVWRVYEEGQKLPDYLFDTKAELKSTKITFPATRGKDYIVRAYVTVPPDPKPKLFVSYGEIAEDGTFQDPDLVQRSSPTGPVYSSSQPGPTIPYVALSNKTGGTDGEPPKSPQIVGIIDDDTGSEIDRCHGPARISNGAIRLKLANTESFSSDQIEVILQDELPFGRVHKVHVKLDCTTCDLMLNGNPVCSETLPFALTKLPRGPYSLHVKAMVGGRWSAITNALPVELSAPDVFTRGPFAAGAKNPPRFEVASCDPSKPDKCPTCKSKCECQVSKKAQDEKKRGAALKAYHDADLQAEQFKAWADDAEDAVAAALGAFRIPVALQVLQNDVRLQRIYKKVDGDVQAHVKHANAWFAHARAAYRGASENPPDAGPDIKGRAARVDNLKQGAAELRAIARATESIAAQLVQSSEDAAKVAAAYTLKAQIAVQDAQVAGGQDAVKNKAAADAKAAAEKSTADAVALKYAAERANRAAAAVEKTADLARGEARKDAHKVLTGPSPAAKQRSTSAPTLDDDDLSLNRTDPDVCCVEADPASTLNLDPKEHSREFVIGSAANFSRPGFSGPWMNGPVDRYHLDGAIIYENMRFKFSDKDGRYELRYCVSTPETVKLRLQILVRIRDGNDDRWQTLTLPAKTITFDEDSSREDVDRPQQVVVRGIAPFLAGRAALVCGVARRGTARFGSLPPTDDDANMPLGASDSPGGAAVATTGGSSP